MSRELTNNLFTSLCHSTLTRDPGRGSSSLLFLCGHESGFSWASGSGLSCFSVHRRSGPPQSQLVKRGQPPSSPMGGLAPPPARCCDRPQPLPPGIVSAAAPCSCMECISSTLCPAGSSSRGTQLRGQFTQKASVTYLSPLF